MSKQRQFGFGKFRRDRDQIFQARNVEGEWVEYKELEEAIEVATRLDTAYRVVHFVQESWTYERKDVPDE